MANENNSLDLLKFSALFISVCLVLAFFGRTLSAVSLPVSEDNSIPVTVVLDPGHGGEDGGACTYGGMPEKELNLLIATEVYHMLSATGINVIMTRTEDILLYDPTSDHEGKKKSMDLAARLNIAQETPDAILVSIHMNAFPESKYGGLQVYYSTRSEGGRTLASYVQDDNKTFLSPDNHRKIKAAGKNIYLLDRFEGTGILVECGFLSNPDNRERLNSSVYRHELSALLFCSILRYISDGGR